MIWGSKDDPGGSPNATILVYIPPIRLSGARNEEVGFLDSILKVWNGCSVVEGTSAECDVAGAREIRRSYGSPVCM